MSITEKLFEYGESLRRALRAGWLGGDDRGAYCNFCRETAEHRSPDGHVCEHAADCLMVKHAELVGDVNDGEEP